MTETWIPSLDGGNGRGFFAVLDRMICWLVVLGLILLTGILITQVIARYVAHSPTVWSEELAVSLFVWISMLAIPLGFRRGEHLTIDFLVRRLKPPASKVSAIVIAALCVLTLGLIGWLAVGILPAADRQLLTGIARGLGIPAKVSWVYAAIPLGCALAIAFVLERLAWLLRGRVTVLNEDADRMFVENFDTELEGRAS
ncbi:TRAP-type C4-dicarboxylate transport system permease small subunit [Georgenia soli]|uniref:TRAP-type C4-dicarboxylate transport system permease small subunit n=1 Tax=Georgenia soli TaxID=638953 RepID=A0A2A9F267_9MICO|nr:TRAP transporter small permease [Georgenia soli]PFG45093.1 TRAP-type C4-dicarboxylate transport system permease small subunit [Georgenia soli]